MPITVNCPSCSVTFKTKDEYAGKRAKCPKCAAPITIPVVDTVLMPPPPKGTVPVAARPVVASKPKPAPVPVDDEAEPVSTKRKRGESAEDDEKSRSKKRGKHEDADEKPKGKRPRGEEDEDDGPKKKRRRRDDDDEPKKKSALPLILGILGGVLLVCVGGCAGVWFGVIAPAAEQARKRNAEQQAELERWEKEFNKPPSNPGWNPGPGVTPGTGSGNTPGTQPGDTKPPTTYAKSSKPIAVLSPDEFANDFTKYIDQWVVVKGKLAKDLGEFDEWDSLELERGDGPKFQYGGIGSTVLKGGLKKGTEVEVWGFVANPMYFADKRHELRSPLLLSTPVKVTAADLLDDYRKTPKDKIAKYDGQTFHLTGTVRKFDSVQRVIFEEKQFDGTKYVLIVNFESGDDKNFKVGDTITALVRGRYLQDAVEGKEVSLLNARFISKE